MAVGSKLEFVECLKASQILKPGRLEELLKTYPTENVKKFASRLVQNGTLTHWQAKVLYSGRSKLNLGNYILLDLIRSDELGERFRANHKSLDRPVEIQLLPKSVSESAHLQNSFVGNVSLISELDHPHITDIHDVDREGAQFFLVNEAHDGQPLDSIEITPHGLVLCTHQILQALAFAHSQSVIHGEVDSQNIVCVDQAGFKICGMGLSLVRQKITGNKDATARDDLIALAIVLEKRFLKLSPTQQQEYEWLGKKLARLKQDPIAVYPRVVVATEKTIGSWGKNQPAIIANKDSVTSAPKQQSTQIKTNLPSSPAATPGPPAVSEAPAINVQQPPRKTKSGIDQSAGRSGVHDTAVAKPSIFHNPILWGIAGLGFIGLATLAILFAAGFFSSDKKTAAVDKSKTEEIKKDVSDTNDKKEPESKPVPTKLTPEDVAKALAEAQGRDVEPVPPVDANAGRQPSIVPRENEMVPSANENKVETVEQPENESPEAPVLEDTLDPSSEQRPPENSRTPDAGKKTVKPDPPKVVALSNFDSVIELPTSEIKTPFSIGELGVDDVLTAVEIISLPSAFATGRGVIEIEPTGKKSWNVLLLAKAGGKSTPVADLAIVDEALTFTWKEEVSKKSRANAIRNCVLKLSAGNSSKEIMLREPALLKVGLTQEAYSQKLKTGIAWLPQSESVRIEVTKPDEPWPGRLYTAGETEFPETFSFDEFNPTLPVFFDDDPEYQNLSVVIQPEIGKTLAFNIGVFAKGKETAAVRYDSPESAENTIQLLQRARENLALMKQQAQAAVDQAVRAQNGKITKRRDELAAVIRELKNVEENQEISKEVRDQLRELHEHPLPITVYYELDGRRVIIAKTSSE
jgi:hypothetical protein